MGEGKGKGEMGKGGMGQGEREGGRRDGATKTAEVVKLPIGKNYPLIAEEIVKI